MYPFRYFDGLLDILAEVLDLTKIKWVIWLVSSLDFALLYRDYRLFYMNLSYYSSKLNFPMKAEDLPKLVTFVMPYGKYKGRVLADLPGHYLNWFAREGFPNNELGQLLALMQEIDHNGLTALLDPIRKATKSKWL